MASKKCLMCSNAFSGRRDAKTCSAKCRKRLQKVRWSFAGPARGSRLSKTLAIAFTLLAGLLTVALNINPAQTNAATSSYLNFQARLLTNSGNVVADGDYNVEFKIYDSLSSGSSSQGVCSLDSSTDDCWWLETRTGASKVRIVNGYLTVNLGSVTAFGSSIPWDQQLYLSMNIGGTGTASWDGEMSPRVHLTALPYAFTAGKLTTGSGSSRGTLSFASLGQATSITLPDPGAGTATVCYQNASACGFAASTGSGSYIQNGATVQTNANFAIQSAGTGSVGGLIRGASGQTADLLQLQTSTPTTVFSVGATGAVLSKNSSNSTTAFQIQNATGGSLLNVDSSNSVITLNGLNYGDIQSWTTNANTITSRDSAASVAANGYVYQIGGSNAGAQTTVSYAKLNANGSVGTWTTTSALPAATTGLAATVSNGYVYAVGGSTAASAATAIKKVYYAKLKADGTLGTWATANDLPAERWYPSTVAANGYIYAIGGKDTANVVQDTAYYAKLNADGSVGSWTATSIMTGNPRYTHGSVVANGYVYVVGGTPNTTASTTVLKAKLNSDGTLGSWSTTNSLPAGRENPATVVVGGYIYAIGGYDGSADNDDTYYAKLNADGTVNAWSTSSKLLPANVSNASFATSNGYIYVMSGSGGTNIYYTSTARIQMAGSLDLVGISGQYLNEGGTGGELTAGNTNIVGDLSVRGMASVTQGLSVGGELSVGSSALFKNSSNSTTAFQIQNASGGNLFLVDSTNSNITLNGGNSGETNAWQTNSSSGFNARDAYCSLAVNGYFYAVGGAVSGASTSTVQYTKINANGSLGNWASTTAIDVSGAKNRYAPACATANGYVYVMGGSTTTGAGGGTSTTYYAKVKTDGTLGTWASTTSIPAARTTASGTVYNGYIYVIGGNTTAGGSVDTVYYAKLNADGTVGAWSTSTTGTNAGSNSSTIANGYLYIISSDGSTAVQYAQLGANGAPGTWSTTTALPEQRANTSTVVANGYMYVIGGRNGASNYRQTVYYAAISSTGTVGSWSTSANQLPAVKEGFGNNGVMVNGYMYAIGGWNGSSQLSTQYYASVSRIKVAGALDLVGIPGASLGETALGGELTAGNTTVLGKLDVRGSANIGRGLLVGDFFQVQNASGGNMFSVDSGTSTIALNSNNTGEVQAWTTESDTLTASRFGGSSVTINGYIYYVGGQSGGTEASNVYSAKLNADGSTGAWSSNTSLPDTRSYGAVTTANGYIYVISGQDGTPSDALRNSVYYAKVGNDGTIGTWKCQGADSTECGTTPTNTTNVPSAATASARAFVSNGYIYLVGGALNTAGSSVSSAVSYAKLNADGSTGTWATTTSLPYGVQRTATTIANNYVYVTGGIDVTNTHNSILYAPINANGTIGSWSCQGTSGATSCNGATITNANSLAEERRGATAVAQNGYLYIIGGRASGAGSVRSTVYYARLNSDGSTGSFTTASNSLPVASTDGALTSLNGYFYYLGGDTNAGSTATNTVYYTSVSRIKVAGSLDLVGISGSDYLDNGNQGGSLTAGNTNILGTLGVRGSADFLQGVSVGDTLAVGGSALFKNASDSTTAFQVQNSTGANLMQIDSSNFNITLNGGNNGALQSFLTTSTINAVRAEVGSVAYGGYLYRVGGVNASGTVQGDVEYAKINADGSVGTWTVLSSTPLPGSEVRTLTSVTAANGFIYVTGGYNSGLTITSSVYYAKIKADGTLGSWITGRSMNDTRSTHTSFVYNGYLYAIGGRSQTNFQLNTSEYAKINADGSVGTWTTNVNNFAVIAGNAGKEAPAVTYANGYVYVLGGNDGGSSSTTAAQYAKLNLDGSIGTFTSTTALPAAIGYTGAGVRNGYVYTFGGFVSGTTARRDVYYAPLNADGSVGTWTTIANALPAARANSGVTSANGYFYVIGGDDGNSPSGAANTTYYSSVARIKVAGAVDLVGLSGENLAEGGSGGELTAGNTNIIGNLSVQGTAAFRDGVSIGNILTVNASAIQLTNTITYLGGGDATGGTNTGANGGDFNSSVIVDSYAYFVKNGSGATCTANTTQGQGCEFQVWDYSIPTAPTLVGAADGAGITGGGGGTGNVNARWVAVSGKYAYVAKAGSASTCSQTAGSADGCELTIFDISNPRSPVFVGGGDADGTTNGGSGADTFNQITVSGRYAYIAKDPNSTSCASAIGCELQVWDIANPYRPTYVGGADASGTANSGTSNSIGFISVVAYGNYVYVGKSAALDSTACSSSTGTNAQRCEVQAYDVSNPASPSYAYGIDSSGTVGSGTSDHLNAALYVSGNYLYVAKSSSGVNCSSAAGCELQIYKINNTGSSTPTYVGGADSSGGTNTGTNGTNPYSITVSGRYAYVGYAGNSAAACSQSAGSAQGCELKIYDVATPSTPTYVAGMDSNGTTTGSTAISFRAIAVASHYAAVAQQSESATNCSAITGCEAKFFDITGFEATSITAGNITTSNIQAQDVVVTGSTSLNGALSIAKSAQISGSLAVGGTALFQNASNSTTAFQIQNAAGTSLLSVDTTNTKVTLTNTDISSTLPTLNFVNSNASASNIFADDFNRANGTLTDSNWGIKSGGFDIVSNEVSRSSVSGGSSADVAYHKGGPYASANYSVQAVVNASGAASETYVGVVGRRVDGTSSDSSGYYALLRGDTGVVYLFARDGSAHSWGSALGTYTIVGYSSTTDYTIKLVMNGTNIDVYVDGTLRIDPSANSTFTAAGDGGISAGTSGITGATWDNFTVDFLSGGDDFTIKASGGKTYLQGSSATNGSLLTLDYLNNRLGVGTASPTATLDVRGDALLKSSSDSTTAFQIQNAIGSNALLVDTTSINTLLTNSSYENSSVSTWAYSGAAGGSVSRNTTQYYIGGASLGITTGTTAAAFDGVKSTLNSTLSTSTTYYISWYDYITSGTFTDVIARFSYDGTTGNASNCTSINTQTVSTSGWTRHTCQFTTGSAGTAPTSSNAIFIVQQGANGGTQRTFYIDAVQVQTTANTAFKETGIALNGVINSAISVQNTSNSTTALQIQNASGTSLFTADTTNMNIVIGDATNNVTISTGGIVLSGSARNTKKIVLTPEYVGAVLSGSGTGTMTAGYDSTFGNTGKNYYNWTTTQVSSQAYDVVITTSVPSDWDEWAASNAISIDVWSDNFTNSTGTVTVFGSQNATADVNGTSITPTGSTSTWETKTANLTSSSSYYIADGMMVVKLHVTANNNSNFRLGNVTLTYLDKF